MMGSFFTRALVMALGYAYPAYECFKTVEKNKPEIEQLRFWCQYWILVAVLTVFERVGDAFISWLPMYSEAKLAFFIYLWYPRTRGTTYVYDTFFRPYVAKHETEIDRNLLELRARAGDMAVCYWQKAATYGQTRFFEILQYVASQSQSPRPRPAQQRQQPARQPPPPAVSARQPPPVATARQPAAASQQPQQSPRAPPSPAKSQAHDTNREAAGPALSAPPAQPPKPSAPSPPNTDTTTRSTSSEAEAMQVEATTATAATNQDSNPPPPPIEETVMEEVIRVTRGRLRKTRAATTATATTTR